MVYRTNSFKTFSTCMVVVVVIVVLVERLALKYKTSKARVIDRM
jgi:hypothetical protein